MMKSLVGLLLYMAQRDKSKPISVLERLYTYDATWLGGIQAVSVIGCCHACMENCSLQLPVK